jgi:hypothetical protein
MSAPLRLHTLSLALAMGTTFAVMMFLFGLIAWTTGLWAGAVEVIGTAYLGYAPTLVGSLIGALWGFVDGFVFAGLIAWLYNVFCHALARAGN